MTASLVALRSERNSPRKALCKLERPLTILINKTSEIYRRFFMFRIALLFIADTLIDILRFNFGIQYFLLGVKSPVA